MNKLFDDNSQLSEEGIKIYYDVLDSLKIIYSKYNEYSLYEMELLIHQANFIFG